MFKKSEPSMAHTHQAGETIIAEGVKVEGEFRSNGDISIDGELNGSLATAEALRVGESAIIHAEVQAKTAVVAGVIVGNVHATESLELLESSNVEGDIQTLRLSIAPGATVNGKITMGTKES